MCDGLAVDSSSGSDTTSRRREQTDRVGARRPYESCGYICCLAVFRDLPPSHKRIGQRERNVPLFDSTRALGSVWVGWSVEVDLSDGRVRIGGRTARR